MVWAARDASDDGPEDRDDGSTPFIRRTPPSPGGRFGNVEDRASVVIVPGERDVGTRGRRRTLFFVVLAGAVVALALVRPDLIPYEPLRSLVTGEEGPGTSPSGAVRNPASAAGAERPAPLRARVERLLDSLDVSLRQYGERRTDFSLRRLSCEGLARGYADVDDDFVAVTRAMQAAGASLDPSIVSRYRTLALSTDSVSRHFDGTGCARPR